jgi:hypothetical protein
VTTHEVAFNVCMQHGATSERVMVGLGVVALMLLVSLALAATERP